MSCVTSRADVERFKSAIAQGIGLQFDETGLISWRGAGAAPAETRASGDAYLRGLEEEPSRGEMMALARELTVCETSFFRNQEQFDALARSYSRPASGRAARRRCCARCQRAALRAKRPIPSPSRRERESPIRRGASASARSISIPTRSAAPPAGVIRRGRCARLRRTFAPVVLR